MKTLLIVVATGTVCLSLVSFSIIDNSLTLQQAIDEKKVQVTVLPYGETGYSDGLRVNVKNISGKTLKLKMPKGTLFVPDNSGEQTLVTSGDELFTLGPDHEKLVVRRGFCTEKHDSGSDAASTFQLSYSKNANLVNILGYMDSLNITDEDMIQYAVWSITDHTPVSYVQNDDTTATRLVQQRVCALTVQEMPWYETKANIVQTPQHEFVIQPLEITGEITFNSDVPVVLQGTVEDSTGKVLYTNPHQSTAPDGEITFDYLLHVEGWAPGKYYVVYTNNGKEFIRREFVI